MTTPAGPAAPAPAQGATSTSGAEQAGGQTGGAGAPSQEGSTPAPEAHVTPAAPAVPVVFTAEQQAQVDRLIGQARARFSTEAQTSAARAAEEARTAAEQAGKDAVHAARTGLQTELRKARAELVALQAGARPDRLDDVLNLTSLDGIAVGDDGTIDRDALATAINGTLSKFTEWKTGAAAPTTPASGATDYSQTATATFTLAQVEAMAPAELDANMAQIEKQMAAGTLK